MTMSLFLMTMSLIVPCSGVKTGKLLGLWTGNNISVLYDINIDNGYATDIAVIDYTGSDSGLAVSPDGTLYATFTGGNTELAIIDPGTGDFELVGLTGFNDICNLEFAPDGTLYGVDVTTDQLVTLDINTGEGTIVGPLGVNVSSGGLAFSPYSPSGVLYLGATNTPPGGPTRASLFSMNTKTGTVTLIGDFGPIFDHANSMAAIGDTLYGSSVDIGIGDHWLVQVNKDTGEATIIGIFDYLFGIPMDGMAFLPGAGDVDRDGDVDLDDYDILVSCFTGPLNPGGDPLPVGCVFLDSDDDNDIDCIDWEAFIVNWTEDEAPPTFDKCDKAPPCEGDANGDGTVDPLDAGFVSARFGCPVGTGDPECDAADQSGDGLVDPLDVGFVLARFGPCP